MSKLYRIWQDVNGGYDTYDSAIVVARSEDEARKIHPRACNHGRDWTKDEWAVDEWAMPDDVGVEQLGTTRMRVGTVVCASYNAG